MTIHFKIQNKEVGSGTCFIIAEVAQAHDGSLGTAHAYIDAVAETGVDAVKFQTHIANAESTPSEPWRVKFSCQDKSRFDYWKRMEFTAEQWSGLKAHAEERGLIFLSSPFSVEALDLLHKLKIGAWKVASGEVSNSILIEKMVQSKLPILLSSGMSNYAELDTTISSIKKSGVPYGVFQCTTSYPTDATQVGLNLLQEFKKRYSCPVGLSDHSGNIYSGLGAIALGADLLELHVVLSKKSFGPDVSSSVTPKQLSNLVEGTRFIETATKNPIDKNILTSELAQLRQTFTKSIYLSKNLKAGTVLNKEHLTFKKPGNGIPADEIELVLGKSLKVDKTSKKPILYKDLH